MGIEQSISFRKNIRRLINISEAKEKKEHEVQTDDLEDKIIELVIRVDKRRKDKNKNDQ